LSEEEIEKRMEERHKKLIEESKPLYGEPIKELALALIVKEGGVDSADHLQWLICDYTGFPLDDDRGFGLACLALDDLEKEGLIEWREPVFEPTEKGKANANLEETEVKTFLETPIKVLSVARKASEWLVEKRLE